MDAVTDTLRVWLPITVGLMAALSIFIFVARVLGNALLKAFESNDVLLLRREADRIGKQIENSWKWIPGCYLERISPSGTIVSITPKFDRVEFGLQKFRYRVRTHKLGIFGYKSCLPLGVTIDALFTSLDEVEFNLQRRIDGDINQDRFYITVYRFEQAKRRPVSEHIDTGIGYVIGDDGELQSVPIFEEKSQ